MTAPIIQLKVKDSTMAKSLNDPGLMAKLLIVGALAVAVGAAFIARPGATTDEAPEPVAAQAAEVVATPETESAATTAAAAEENQAEIREQPEPKALPKLVDLGAGKCIPCKMMAPILEELRIEYEGRFDVIFIDVWENRLAGEQYGVRMIPTQIFLDAEGNELLRHEGFYSKEDILATWKELGQDFSGPASSGDSGSGSLAPAG